MSVFHISNMKAIDKLFDGWQETLIWSCLQGCMGSAWADDIINPTAVQIVIADFCFLAGEPKSELVLNKPEEYNSDFIIMVPRTREWGELIEDKYKDFAKKITRYAIKKEPDVFNVEYLNGIVNSLKEPFEIRMFDQSIYEQVMSNRWSQDLCSHFKDYKDFSSRGIGAVVLENDIVVSGASSYTVYREGIEIEIDTRQDYRRKGLALACGAKLILECLKRGLYPSWDAHNKGSLALAEKLGYHFDHEYTCYEVTEYTR